MSNKIIFTTEGGTIQSLLFEEGLCTFTIEKNGVKKKYSIEDEHEQECCEGVYCDFLLGELYKKQMRNNLYINFFEIKEVIETGILLCFGDYPLNRILLPCYNLQNGYYSSELNLIITEQQEGCEKKVTKIDISSCEQDG